MAFGGQSPNFPRFTGGGELWSNPDPPEPPFDWMNKVVLPICGAIILFGAWYYGWLPLDAIKEIVCHDIC